ncbi:MAG: hypothetical protein CM15mP32_5050 [Flavobacteriaceae bacterium]|nr:MAG: hypothetical protein CM15mP32_5050 [Flavobacteriaceae bacterium]
MGQCQIITFKNMKMINTNLSPVDPNKVSQIKLVDGSLMPQAAMGTFHSDNPDLMKGMEDIVIEAIRLGYRHIDCATAYQMKRIVGQAIEKSIKSGVVKRRPFYTFQAVEQKYET